MSKEHVGVVERVTGFRELLEPDYHSVEWGGDPRAWFRKCTANPGMKMSEQW